MSRSDPTTRAPMTIQRNAYHSEDAFQDEISRIFGKGMFIGTRHDFGETDAYSSFQLGRHALTCRATPDGVRAFNNVCLHRNALIDPAGSGIRPFRCRYHGWTYDAAGALSQSPLADPDCISNRKLQAYPLHASEGLLFTSLDASSPDLSEIPSLLQRLALEPAVPFYRGELEHECNWKLLVENVLEGYHLNFVHARSFLPGGINSSTPGTWGGNAHTSWCQARPENAPALAALRHFPGARHQYLHGYVFPNLFLANTNNLIGFISSLIPVSAGKTLLRWQLFELAALRALPDNVREQLRNDAIAFSHQVLNEDKPVVEACQAGLRSVGPDVQLQPSEARILHFHEMYREAMDDPDLNPRDSAITTG